MSPLSPPALSPGRPDAPQGAALPGAGAGRRQPGADRRRAAAAPTAVLAQATESRRGVAIAAGPLSQALNAYASAAGVELTMDASLLQGKRSAGLSGSYTVEEGFAELLRGQDCAPRAKRTAATRSSPRRRRTPPCWSP